MNLEMIRIDAIREYERNPRINDAAVGPVAESIKAFGFKVPIIIDAENVLVAGHTRVKAARLLGMTELPAVRADDLTPEQIRAFRLAENKLHELATWDLDLLPAELLELQALDVDLGLLGFNQDELAQLLDPGVKAGLCDPDDIPEPPDQAVTRLGDLWSLGDHRLLCGDSASADDVDRLLGGATIDLVNMDPPYGVRVEPRSNNAIAAGLSSFEASASASTVARSRRGGLTHHQGFDVARQGAKSATTKKLRPKDRPLQNDFVTAAAFDAMLLAWFSNASRVLKPGGSFFCWGGYKNLGDYPGPLRQAGLYFSQAIVWDKQHPVLTRKDYMGAFEICFYGWKEGAGHDFYGPNNATDLWHVKKVNPQSMIHLTEKPVELAVRAIQYSSRAGENVLDLFGGSGSTLIAAEQTGRRAFLMELDQLYADIIVTRWEQFSGRKAKRVHSQAEEEAPVIAEASSGEDV